MRAIGQITITNICDVAASDTPPENPYVGQMWVDTSVSPPETKIWNGAEWVVHCIFHKFHKVTVIEQLHI